MHRVLLALPTPTSTTGGGQSSGTQHGNGSPGGGPFFMLILLLVVVMFLFVMPLFNKRERQRRGRLQELKKHDRVVTTGGIYGTIVSLDETTLTLEVDKDVRLRVKRGSVYDVERPNQAKAETTKSGK